MITIGSCRVAWVLYCCTEDLSMQGLEKQNRVEGVTF